MIGPLFVLSIAGCATTYHPVSFTGGYTDNMLAPNVALVNFRGNGFSNAADVTKMALLRAAEVTSQHGYRFFVIASTQDISNSAHAMIPGYASTTVFSPSFATTTFSPGGFVPIHKPGISLTIQMGNDQQALARLGIVYEAAYLRNSLKSL